MRIKVITGVTGDQPLSLACLRRVRVGGTANLIGAVQVKAGSTVLETLPVGATPGTERVYDDASFGTDQGQLQINMANAGDTVIVFYG
jgi:hypothetical protein